MSYGQFLALFILPPIGIVVVALARRPAPVPRWGTLGAPALAVIALLYTTPWDNHLIRVGVWDYGPGRTVATIGAAPLEEYLFFLLQPLLTGLFLLLTLGRFSGSTAVGLPEVGRARVAGVGFWLAVAAAGGLLASRDTTYYLGMILAWAAPVLALQWGVAAATIARHREAALLGVSVPTVYLWAADRIAIGSGIWRISDRFTVGWSPFGLPVEEAVFFFVTNLLVVQGMLAILWATERYALPRRVRRANPTPARRCGQPS